MQKVPSLDDYLHAKRDPLISSRDIDEERTCNLIGQEVQLATPTEKWYSQMISFFGDYHHAKNPRDRLIASRDIDDQRILQSDWLKAF